MDWITLGTLVWLAIFLVLGFFRGFWQSLAALVSLVLAYWASAKLASPVVTYLTNVFPALEPQRVLVWWGCAVLLFLLVGLLSRLLIQTLGKLAPVGRNPTSRLVGALISGTHGAALAVFFIWSLSLLSDTLELQEGEAISDPPKVVQFSRQIVGDIVSWNISQSGSKGTVADLSTAFAERPSEVLQGVRGTLQSQELKDMIASEEIRQIVRSHDVDELLQTAELDRLLEQPNVQQLLTALQVKGEPISRENAARQLLDVWHKVELVGSDPEVQSLVADPDVQDFLQNRKGPAPALYGKLQKLLQLVTSKTQPGEVVDEATLEDDAPASGAPITDG